MHLSPFVLSYDMHTMLHFSAVSPSTITRTGDFYSHEFTSRIRVSVQGFGGVELTISHVLSAHSTIAGMVTQSPRLSAHWIVKAL